MAAARPVGAPFWGESVQVGGFAWNVTGSALPTIPGNPDFGTPDHGDASPLIYRGPLNDGPPSVALNSGDAIQLTADVTGVTYLQDGDPVEASWVVEVVSGSGALHLSQALNSTNFDGPIATPTDLGTITITGAGTYTLTAPGVTSGYIYDRIQGEATGLPIVTIATTSGTVQVQQVKMRLWPAGGALGAFTGRGTEDDYSSDASRLTISQGVTETREGDDDATLWGETWTAARALHATASLHDGDDMGTIGAGTGAFDKTLWTQPLRASFRVESVVTLSEPAYRTSVALITGDAWMQRPADEDLLFVMPDGTDGIDYIRRPTEVAGDPIAYAVFDAPPVLSWDPVYIENPANPNPGTQIDSTVNVHVAEGEWPLAAGHGTYNSVGADGLAGATLSCWPGVEELVALPIPNTQTVRVAAEHEWFDGGQPGPHGSGAGTVFNPRVAVGQAGGRIVSVVGGERVPPQWHVAFTPFTYWVPGPAKAILPLRQFPRNDGLRGGPPGLTPSSRQAGRGNGYL